MLNDYKSSYDDLLKRSRKPSMNLRRTRTLGIELYKAINDLSPEFMKYLFKVCQTNRIPRQQYKLNLEISKSSQFLLVLKVCVYKALGF